MDSRVSATTQLSPHLYAAIDLGSNSFHMMVVSVSKGHVQIINRLKQKVRLASGLNDALELDQQSMERGWQCLSMFAERLQDIPTENIQIVATATLRLAKNADTFVTKASSILGHSVKVITGEEEASHIYRGVAYTSASQSNTLVIDIGGASTEIIAGNDLEPIDLVSLDMGCVTYMDRYFPKGKLTKKAFQNAIDAAKAELQPVLKYFKAFNWEQCLGASGTPQAISEIMNAQGANDAIRLSYLGAYRKQCCDCLDMDHLEITGLQETRKAIFPAGLAILIAIFEMLDIETMQLSGGALREGLIYGMLEERHETNDRVETVDGLIERFHIDVQQANRVRSLALNLLHQTNLKAPSGFDPEVVLKVAALLHEIGLHIEFKKHHLHGAYILQNLPLIGFNKQQQDCIRLLIQNHRQAFDLTAIDQLAPELRNSMHQLTRIIRLADLLCVRRKDDVLPKIELQWNEQKMRVNFPKNWLKEHPLIRAELENEKGFQKQVGWKLEFD